MCFPGLCRDSSSAVVAETRMARRATFDLLVELGPRVRRPRTLEPGRAHRRRLSLRRMHARCASPASRSFKPWVRVPMPRQETRFGKSQCVRAAVYKKMLISLDNEGQLLPGAGRFFSTRNAPGRGGSRFLVAWVSSLPAQPKPRAAHSPRNPLPSDFSPLSSPSRGSGFSPPVARSSRRRSPPGGPTAARGRGPTPVAARRRDHLFGGLTSS